MPKQIPKAVSRYMASLGKKGGKRSLETMTPEARTERAKKAQAAQKSKQICFACGHERYDHGIEVCVAPMGRRYFCGCQQFVVAPRKVKK